MKAFLWVLPMALIATANANEGKEEITKCWFEGKGKDPIECKVVLKEEERNGPGGASEADASSKREIVKLYVECDCDFDLEDEWARQFDKGDEEYTLGTERGNLALLAIEEKDRGDSLGEWGHERKASLLISSKYEHDRKDGLTERLEGKCEKVRGGRERE